MKLVGVATLCLWLLATCRSQEVASGLETQAEGSQVGQVLASTYVPPVGGEQSNVLPMAHTVINATNILVVENVIGDVATEAGQDQVAAQAIGSIPYNQQCGGRSTPGCGAAGRACTDAAWTGATCVAGHFCRRDNEWWWSCQPGGTAPPPASGSIPYNQQCGGRSTPGCGAAGRACADAAWTGATCVAGHFCRRDNEWWWSCQPGATSPPPPPGPIPSVVATISLNQQCGGMSTPGCGFPGRACADKPWDVLCSTGLYCRRDTEWWWSCQPEPNVVYHNGFLGCTTTEAAFTQATYFGGSAGASFYAARRIAAQRKARYFAVARNSANDGFGFTFDSWYGVDPTPDMPSCKASTCTDVFSNMPYPCGSTSQLNRGGPARVWAVYKMPENACASDDDCRGVRGGTCRAAGTVHPHLAWTCGDAFLGSADTTSMSCMLAKEAINAVDGAQTVLSCKTAQACWVRTQTRGVGTIPRSCRDGEELNGALCYPRCRDGFVGVGPVCWQTCPSTHTDIGAICSRVVQHTSASGSCPLIDICGMTVARHCKSCPSGFNRIGCDCWRGDQSFAKSSYGRGFGSLPSCGPNEDLDAGLCYTKCPAGLVGVGPLCYMRSRPAGWVPCGSDLMYGASEEHCKTIVQSVLGVGMAQGVNMLACGGAMIGAASTKAAVIAANYAVKLNPKVALASSAAMIAAKSAVAITCSINIPTAFITVMTFGVCLGALPQCPVDTVTPVPRTPACI